MVYAEKTVTHAHILSSSSCFNQLWWSCRPRTSSLHLCISFPKSPLFSNPPAREAHNGPCVLHYPLVLSSTIPSTVLLYFVMNKVQYNHICYTWCLCWIDWDSCPHTFLLLLLQSALVKLSLPYILFAPLHLLSQVHLVLKPPARKEHKCPCKSYPSIVLSRHNTINYSAPLRHQ